MRGQVVLTCFKSQAALTTVSSNESLSHPRRDPNLLPAPTDMENRMGDEDTGKDATEPGKKPRKSKAQPKPKQNPGKGQGKGGDENKPPKAKTPEQEAKTVTWLDPFFHYHDVLHKHSSFRTLAASFSLRQ